MTNKAAGIILRIVTAALIIGILALNFPLCKNCGSIIFGDQYKAYGSTYCDSCAHSLYPHATWK